MVEYVHPIETSIPSHDSWKLFRIISEFVDGFDTLAELGPSVSIFGSSRLPQTSHYYLQTIEIAHKAVKKGFSVITGAGPSIMEAANKGAQEAKGNSCGLIIDLPFESEPNSYIDPKLRLRFRYFFIRKVMFVRYADGFIFLPGGYGTLDELFEIITLIQTTKIEPVPIYLVGSSYWNGLFQWIKEVCVTHKCVYQSELNIVTITDNIDQMILDLQQSYKDRKRLEGRMITG